MSVGRVDRYQREHAWVGFPLAVIYKFFDDRGPHQAALITYYAFVSLFPLLLLFTSAAGFVLEGYPHLRQELVNAAVSDLPDVGGQIRNTITGFKGSTTAIVIGVVGTLYAAPGMMLAAQTAFNRIYGVPRFEQPDPLHSRIRSLGLLLLLGLGVLCTTGLTVVGSDLHSLSRQLGAWTHLGIYAVTFLVDAAVFTGAYQLLTAEELHWRDVLLGGVISGAVWELLQVFGGAYVAHEVSHATALYGTFGVVLAAIAWIYLEALTVIIAAEVNVVRHWHLWPRALMALFADHIDFTDADLSAYQLYLAAARYKRSERVKVDFERPMPPPPPTGRGRLSGAPPGREEAQPTDAEPPEGSAA